MTPSRIEAQRLFRWWVFFSISISGLLTETVRPFCAKNDKHFLFFDKTNGTSTLAREQYDRTRFPRKRLAHTLV
jgi:hypothetical protein